MERKAESDGQVAARRGGVPIASAAARAQARWGRSPTLAQEDGEASWALLLAEAIGGGTVTAAYQPIVDVARGTVVGFEALARFKSDAQRNVESWFTAARAYGVGAELEAVAIAEALRQRPNLPPNCFLTINVSPDLLGSTAVRTVLSAEGDLTGVVIELTEQTQIESYVDIEPHLNAVRAAGALIAVDDTGSGYSGLNHLLQLRPSIIKLDRQLVRDIDRDEAKRALVEMLGQFASRINASILAEGIETSEEHQVIARLGVPLAQGYLFARPGEAWPEPDPQLLRQGVVVREGPWLSRLLEVAPVAASIEDAAPALSKDDRSDFVVLVDRSGRPTHIADHQSLAMGSASPALVAPVDTPLVDLAQRAIVRSRPDRFMPVVCTDPAGKYLGIVPMERLVDQMARSLSGADQ